jgi:hypothetical protein
MLGPAIKQKENDMNKFLNFLLIALIVSNVFLAFTMVIAPRASMVFLESFLGNPYNLESQVEGSKNKEVLGEIELLKPASGTIESKSQ